MPNYANAKIYQIISPNHPVPYIGSTTQRLSKRMAHHRSQYNPCSSHIVIEAGDAYIELIQEFSCENKEQLNKREGEMIRERDCVNRCVAGRTQAEWVRDNKEHLNATRKVYNEVNHDLVIAKRRAYNEATKERRKAYHEANKEQRNQKARANYKANKEKEKANKQIICHTK